jgi:hypothetical protein
MEGDFYGANSGSNQTSEQFDFTAFMKAMEKNGMSFGTNNNAQGSGLFGIGTANNWTNGINAFTALGGLYMQNQGLGIEKEKLGILKQQESRAKEDHTAKKKIANNIHNFNYDFNQFSDGAKAPAKTDIFKA